MPLVLLKIGRPTCQGFSYLFEISCSAEKMQITHDIACKAIGLDWSNVCSTPYMFSYEKEQADSLVKTGLIMIKNTYSGTFSMFKNSKEIDTNNELNLIEVYMHLVTWQAKNEGWEFNFSDPDHTVIEIGGYGFSECPQCNFTY